MDSGGFWFAACISDFSFSVIGARSEDEAHIKLYHYINTTLNVDIFDSHLSSMYDNFRYDDEQQLVQALATTNSMTKFFALVEADAKLTKIVYKAWLKLAKESDIVWLKVTVKKTTNVL